MQELLWLENLPDETIEGGVELANQLYWNISLKEGGQKWCVFGGDKPIFCTDSREAIDAFLYGLGLAYGVLPEPIFEQLKEEVKKWVE